MKVILFFIILLLLLFFKNDLQYFIDVNFSNYIDIKVDITKKSNVNKKILIYSSDNRDDDYIKLHQQGWKKYSSIHGYTFIFETPCLEVPVYYCKFLKILEFMNKYPTFD